MSYSLSIVIVPGGVFESIWIPSAAGNLSVGEHARETVTKVNKWLYSGACWKPGGEADVS